MQVSYKQTTASSYTVLCDESRGDAILSEFMPQFSVALQEEAKFRAAAAFRQPRSNVATQFQFVVWITYATRQACLKSIRDMAALLDLKLHLKAEEGEEIQYYPNAVVTGYAPRLAGVSAEHAFTLHSDNVTATAP